jgi:hypothetical protein
MHRLLYSLAFALLLGLSLAIKFSGSVEAYSSGMHENDGEIATFLTAQGFAIRQGESGASTTGTRGGCQVQVTDVSPQGWHRSVIAQSAAGQKLVYAFAGNIYPEQPVLRTTLDHYVWRLKRYFRMRPPPHAVRAIIISPGCPADIVNEAKLQELSR